MPNQIRTIIIDDEKLARDIIKKYLSKYPDVDIVDECADGYAALKSIAEFSPDLIFLDIQMPKINGFELLELLDDPPAIIFSTAFDQYALKAFEVNAVDYLLKPFSEERFREAMDKMTIRLTEKSKQKKKIKKLVENVDEQIEYLSRIVVKKNSKIILIPLDEIIYLEAQDDYVLICTENGSYLKSKTMKYFEDHLNPEEFMRIHRSYIINIEEIKDLELFEKRSYKLTLSNEKKLPVSKSGYANLKSILN